jgi:vesicle coat complex subunit
VLPQLNHNNPAVVLSAVKVILKALDKFTDPELRKGTVKKMSAPLVTLLSCEAEL